MQSNQTQTCPKCGKDILKPNFQIHEAMCKGLRESFIMNVNDADFKRYSQERKSKQSANQEKPVYPEFDFLPHEDPSKEKPQKPEVSKEQQKKPKKVPSIDQKIPCPNCGYLMTMAELDTHPATCAVHPKVCPYCKDEYPEDLMNQHKQVCEKRPREQPRPQPQPRVSPRASPRVHGGAVRENITERMENGRRVRIIRRTNEDGTTITQRQYIDEEDDFSPQMVFFMGPQGSGSMGDFPAFFFRHMNSGARGGQGSQGGSGDPFYNMIQNLMHQLGVNRSQNPGLTEQQVMRLPVVKYDKNTNGKKCPNCTICIKDYNDGDILMMLPCGHLFNKECLVPWLKTSSVCPNCRNPVKPGAGGRPREASRQRGRSPRDPSEVD